MIVNYISIFIAVSCVYLLFKNNWRYNNEIKLINTIHEYCLLKIDEIGEYVDNKIKEDFTSGKWSSFLENRGSNSQDVKEDLDYLSNLYWSPYMNDLEGEMKEYWLQKYVKEQSKKYWEEKRSEFDFDIIYNKVYKHEPKFKLSYNLIKWMLVNNFGKLLDINEYNKIVSYIKKENKNDKT